MFVVVIPQFQKMAIQTKHNQARKIMLYIPIKIMCLRCVVLLDIDNTLGGNQGGIYMATLFDVICEQHEKKEALLLTA